MEGVLGKVNVSHLADIAQGGTGAIGPGVRPKIGNLIAIGQHLAIFGLAGVEAGDAGLLQREQFCRLRDAVLVQIAPDAQLGPVRVLTVDLAVLIGVFLSKRGEAIGGLAAGGQVCGITEEFGAVVDGAVVVAVEDEEAVVGGDPAGAVLRAVAVVVEEDGGGGGDADGLQTIAVQV